MRIDCQCESMSGCIAFVHCSARKACARSALCTLMDLIEYARLCACAFGAKYEIHTFMRFHPKINALHHYDGKDRALCAAGMKSSSVHRLRCSFVHEFACQLANKSAKRAPMLHSLSSP